MKKDGKKWKLKKIFPNFTMIFFEFTILLSNFVPQISVVSTGCTGLSCYKMKVEVRISSQ